MIDIHTHVIPALDDGPPDMETSIGIGKLATAEGITVMISTSHSKEGTAVGYDGMKKRLDEVRAAWQDAGLDIRLELGLEIFLEPGTPAELKSGRVWTLAGTRYVLVELPYRPWPTYAEHTLFDLQLAGYVPILAHPERYNAIQSDPNLMYSLAERGVLAQVTAGALLGHQGDLARKSAEVLVQHNLVQILSSDTHGVTERKRMPALKAALGVVESLVGREAAHAMVQTNPAAVLSNGDIIPDPVHVEPHKWSLGRLFGRG